MSEAKVEVKAKENVYAAPTASSAEPRTQKARGLKARWRISSMSDYYMQIAPVYQIVSSPQGITTVREFPWFVRPCPVRPRHGFVESRPVHSKEEAIKVLAETLEADPQGEMIIMPVLTGRFSGVMTSSGITFGMGNDGVTGGKGPIINIPVGPNRLDAVVGAWLGDDYKPDMGIYIELVEHKRWLYIVQVRTGPKLPNAAATRYVPGVRYKVTNVIKIDPLTVSSISLMNWELLLKKYALFGGVVVWLPGQSLSSHFAVQAIANDFAVDTGMDEPKVGEFMLPDNGQIKLSNVGLEALAVALNNEKKRVFKGNKDDIMFLVSVLHSLPFWGDDPHLIKMRAFGAMAAYRYGLAAVIGEARHFPERSVGDKSSKIKWEELPGVGRRHSDRDIVYDGAFKIPFEGSWRWALAAGQDMAGWGGTPTLKEIAKMGKSHDDFGTSFGGPKWEYAAKQVAYLGMNIDKFTKKPHINSWNRIVKSYNALVSAAHNGGYLFTKWASTGRIDMAATMPIFTFCGRRALSLLFPGNNSQAAKKLPPDEVLPFQIIRLSPEKKLPDGFVKVPLLPWSIYLKRTFLEENPNLSGTDLTNCSCKFCAMKYLKKIRDAIAENEICVPDSGHVIYVGADFELSSLADWFWQSEEL